MVLLHLLGLLTVVGMLAACVVAVGLEGRS